MHPYATKIGIIGLLFWSAGALFNSLASAIPTFEILSFALGLGFIAGAIHLTFTKSWHKLKRTSLVTLIGFIGVFGNEFFFVSAFKFAPAAHITLINYLWPILVISFSWLIPKETFCLRTLIAAMIGFASVACVILQDMESVFHSQYWIGYVMVIFGTLMWSIYILVNRSSSAIPCEMITLYCGLGCIVSVLFHLNTESFVVPNLKETIAVLWLGVMGMCVAFYFGIFGIKHGRVGVLSVLSYNNVLFSTGLLILFNQAEFQPNLIFSVLGLMVASFLSFFEIKLIKDKCRQLLFREIQT